MAHRCFAGTGGLGLLVRAGLVSRVPLMPEGVSIEEACEAVRLAVGEGSRLLNFAKPRARLHTLRARRR